MLRRHSTKSKADLQRRKSTSSVRGVPLEHINVAAAERDAKLAAIQAFSRGQDRHSTETALFPPQPGSPHHGEGGSQTRLSRTGSVISRNGEAHGPGLCRRRSVRFVGSDSGLQTRASKISMRKAAVDREVAACRQPLPRSRSSQDVGRTRGTVLLDETHNVRLPDRTSSYGKTLVTTPKIALKEQYLRALAPDPQQYTPEDDVASMPSSYRRVRKSRSMVTPRNTLRNTSDDPHSMSLVRTSSTAGTQQATSRTLRPRFSFLSRKEARPTAVAPSLRAPKSMSFLKHWRGHLDGAAPPCSDPAHDKPAVSPESSFQDHFRQPQELPNPCRLSGSNRHNMRKTLRHSSANTTSPTPETTPNVTANAQGSLRVKARKVSSTMKSRIMSIFMHKSEGDNKVPAQQVEARKTHVSMSLDDDEFGTIAYETVGSQARSRISRVSSRVPSLHTVPSDERLHSLRGSIESVRSESRKVSDERSRVTSWASTEGETIIAHRAQGHSSDEWPRQRLSIITESDLHSPSPSLARPRASLQTITSQEELVPPTIMERLPPGATVDSQRVYSALMRRLGETRQLYDEVVEQRKSSDTSDPFRTLSPPTSEESSSGGSSASLTHAHATASGRLKTENDGLGGRARDPMGSLRSSEATRSPQETSPSPQAVSRPNLSAPLHLSPVGADTCRPKPIVDRSSTFFGSPTSHLFRTKSPWRRTLQEAMEKANSFPEEPTLKTTGSIAAASPITTEAADKKAVTDSASNYSQDTQVHKWATEHELSVAGRSATVGAPATYLPTGERLVSSASSVDWKATLSYEVERTKFGVPSPTRVSGRASEVDYIVPTMPRAFGQGHVREAAQIRPYEEDDHRPTTPPMRMPTNPTTPLSSIEPNIIKLTPQQRSVMQTTPPAAGPLQENVLATSKTTDASGGEVASLVIPRDAMRPRASPLDSSAGSCEEEAGNSNISQSRTPYQDSVAAARQAKPLAHAQSYGGMLWSGEAGSPLRHGASPTIHLMRKQAANLEPNSESVASTPGFSSAFKRHFGPLASSPRRRGDLVEKENQSPANKSQAPGGQAMVDFFLSTRRRQGASSGDGPAFV